MSSERELQAAESSTRGPATTATVGDEDGGVGAGRLRTPFEPPFSIFVPEQVQPRPERSPREDRRDAHTLEMGPLDEHEHEPRASVLDGGSRKANSGGPPSTSSQSKTFVSGPREKKLSWEVLLFPCAVCCDDHNPSPDEGGLPAVRRRPSTLPVLHPGHRYCSRDEIVKPYRAHHCRNCGTVSCGMGVAGFFY